VGRIGFPNIFQYGEICRCAVSRCHIIKHIIKAQPGGNAKIISPENVTTKAYGHSKIAFGNHIGNCIFIEDSSTIV
jgi:hypothetical protein